MASLENISALAEKSDALAKNIGFQPGVDDPFELDTPSVYRASGLFSESAIDTIFGNAELPDATVQPSIPVSVGMLLIRPDMFHLAPRVEAFVEQHFTLRESTTTVVTPDTYWALYADAITGRETAQSRLTRAAVYVGSPCKLLLFEQAAEQGMAAADRMFYHYKGKQGIEQPDTLRGDLVYHEALRMGLHTLADNHLAQAVDPFGAYRKIVRERTASACHELAHPLLFFTGVGIHVPNRAELSRDITLLHASQDAEALHVA